MSFTIMAYCPECKGEMLATAMVCPSCGYDFPVTKLGSGTNREGFAYSGLADIALMLSTIAAGVGAGVAAIVAVAGIASGQLIMGLVTAPIAFFLQLGMLVVFLRVQDL